MSNYESLWAIQCKMNSSCSLKTSTDCLLCFYPACGGNFTGGPGTIQSPNYPDNYPKNVKCFWAIGTDEGFQVRLEFNDFKVCLSESSCTAKTNSFSVFMYSSLRKLADVTIILRCGRILRIVPLTVLNTVAAKMYLSTFNHVLGFISISRAIQA